MLFLKPQREAPRIYRQLVAAALPRIREHASDAKVLVGETAPVGKPGTTIGPAEFMRRWLCLDEDFDRALVDRTCASFTRLEVDGFAHHPYGPTQRVPAKKDIISLLAIRRLGRYLDRAARAGRMPLDLPIYNTEFGLQSNPPDPTVSTTLARQAALINEKEELSYRYPRLRSYSQYLLYDDPPREGVDERAIWSGFQTGLRFTDGRRKPAWAAFRLPIVVHTRGRGRVLVWGRVRPGEGTRTVRLELRRAGTWTAARAPGDRRRRLLRDAPAPRAALPLPRVRGRPRARHEPRRDAGRLPPSSLGAVEAAPGDGLGLRLAAAGRSSGSACAAACSIAAIRSGVSSPAFSRSICSSQSAASAALRSSASTPPRASDLSISANSSSTRRSCGDLPQRLAVGEDHALVLGAGDAEVGVRGLADAVHGAAEHRDLDRLLVALEAPLDLGHDRVHVELQAAAGRAGDQDRAALAQLQRLQDLPGDLDLLLGLEGGERDADRVPHSLRQQRAEADRRLQRAGPLRAALGDAEVERIVDPPARAGGWPRSCWARSST